MTRVVLPVAPVHVVVEDPAPRPSDLHGATIGFLDGWGLRRPDGSYEMLPLMAAVDAVARSAWGVDGREWRRKARAGSLASDEDIATMTACDLVVAGTCLSGGCTAGAVDDATTLEAAGVPTVTLCQENFEPLARAYAAARGFPGLRLFVYPVPVGTNFAEDPEALVRGRLEEFAALVFDEEV